MKKFLKYFNLLLIITFLMSCEKEDFEPIVYDSTEKNLIGEWEITIFKFREINQCTDVDDSTTNLGTVIIDSTLKFNSIYGTRNEGYEPQMRWGNNENSTLEDSSLLGWEWCEEKPLCNLTNFEYDLNGDQLIIGNEIWTITTSFADILVLTNSRGTQYRELVLEK